MNDRRKYDVKLDEIMKSIENVGKLIAEVHTIQQCEIIPQLKKVYECLYGNGKCGIVAEHEVVKEKLNSFDNEFKKIDDAKIWMRRTFLAIIGAILLFLADQWSKHHFGF